MRSLLFLLLLIPVAYIGICVLLYFQQDSLVFFPTRTAGAQVDAEAKGEGFAPWLDARGERIGWQSEAGDPRQALLLFHGNGGQALHRTFYRELCRGGKIDRKLYLLEYPGYGGRAGELSERSFTEAAVSAIDTLAGQPGTDIWLIGESLGSGVACAAAAQRQESLTGLVLVTPFDSFVGAARAHYPWVPVGWLLRTRLDSVENLRSVTLPVAFLLAGRDRVVPSRLGRKLYDGYNGPKRLWEIPAAGHNDTDLLLAGWTQVADWLEKEARSTRAH